MSKPQNREYRERRFSVEELRGHLGVELNRLLPAAECERVLACSNRATQIIAAQSQHLVELFHKGAFDPHANVTLAGALAQLYDQQGKCERIKNFPYPRQFATINLLFVRVFTLLVPFGMLSELEKLGDRIVWLTIPLSMLIAWVFNGIERVGQVTENPFEGGPNDVPITSMSRAIEIDLREMLGETAIPKPIQPENNILM